MTPGSRSWWLGLALLVALLALVRLPALVEAEGQLNSDEAVDGLVLRHLVQHHELTFFNWDATYYGITEGLLTLPFALALGFTPLALKLGALAGCALLTIGIALLARRLYGPAAGLLAAALSVALAPTVLDLSTKASGGYFLVIALGTLTLVLLDRLSAERSAAGTLALGLLAGFGLYTYQLYLPYLLLVLLWLAAQARTLRSAPRRTLAGWISFLVGFGIGWAPYLVRLAGAGPGGKQPSYGIADLARLRANWRLLTHECLPHFFGFRSYPESLLSTGALVGCALFTLVAVAGWLWALRRCRPRRGVTTEALLVLLVPLTLGLFLASRNPTDFYSLRYLLPWLTSLTVLAAGALTALARSPARRAALVLAAAAVAFPAVRLLADAFPCWAGSATAAPEPLRVALRFVASQNLRGGYAPYWIAYRADYLSGERLTFASYQDWDRYPPYQAEVGAMPEVAVIVRARYEELSPILAELLRAYRADIRNRLETSGRPFAVRRFDPYEVYYSPAHERLLGPQVVKPVALARPLAEITATAPALAPPATRLAIAARIVNRSDAGWSATGLPFRAGALRVALAYRWLRADGTAAVVEGERSLLPADVQPGESLAVTPHIVTPGEPGHYQLVLTLVQEEVAWFDQATGSEWRAWVDVAPARPAAG